MEQWFNLLIQVAQPILTTLAYTGTNIFLDTVQTEIKNHQNKPAKLALKSLGLKEDHTATAQRLAGSEIAVTVSILKRSSILPSTTLSQKFLVKFSAYG